MKEMTVPARCSRCVAQTAHDILHEKTIHDEDRIFTYATLECRGCGQICLAGYVRFLDDGSSEANYYPPPVSRKKPSWLLPLIIGLAGDQKEGANLGSLLNEIYQAVHGGQYRLAAMGIRALLEHVMVSKVGDLASFEKNLDAFEKKGDVTLAKVGGEM